MTKCQKFLRLRNQVILHHELYNAKDIYQCQFLCFLTHIVRHGQVVVKQKEIWLSFNSVRFPDVYRRGSLKHLLKQMSLY